MIRGEVRREDQAKTNRMNPPDTAGALNFTKFYVSENRGIYPVDAFHFAHAHV